MAEALPRHGNWGVTSANDADAITGNGTVSPIPEPSVWALLAAGGVLGFLRRRASQS